MRVFKVGDKVEVIGGPHQGRGTVIQTRSRSRGVFPYEVQMDATPSFPVLRFQEELKLVEPAVGNPVQVANERIAVWDCDDTLVLWDKSEFDEEDYITVSYGGHNDTILVPHQKNINLLQKFSRLGYYNIVWSQSGVGWAKAVVEHLDLGKYVDQIMMKPSFYIDDKKADHWMERVYREPDGEEVTSSGKD